MTRTIKVSEVRPGMEVQWTSLGITRRCTGEVVDAGSPRDGVNLRTSEGGAVHIPGDAEVTVLTEPQPEEPTAFGARVVVNGRRFLRSPEGKCDDQPWLEENEGAWWEWYDLINMGPVQVVPDQGWTVPDDAPEVPDRIEEWDTWEDVPEGVVVTTPGLFCHYRKNQGVVEFSDPDNDLDWTVPGARTMPREYGPWTRVTDA